MWMEGQTGLVAIYSFILVISEGDKVTETFFFPRKILLYLF